MLVDGPELWIRLNELNNLPGSIEAEKGKPCIQRVSDALVIKTVFGNIKRNHKSLHGNMDRKTGIDSIHALMYINIGEFSELCG